MATPLIRYSASRAAQQQYISELKSVYGMVYELPDPDYALANDPAIYIKVMRDPVIASAIFQRLHSVAGTEWFMEPATDDDDDKAVAAIIEELLSHISRFEQARYELASAILKGRAYAYIKGCRRRMRIGDSPMLEWWVPSNLRDIDKRRMHWKPHREPLPNGQLSVSQTLEYWSLKRNEWVEVPPHKKDALVVVTYQDREERLGYGEGLIVPIYHYFYAKGRIWQEYMQGIGRWAQGIVAMKMSQDRPGSTDRTNDEMVDNALDALYKMRSQHALVYGEGDEVQVFEGGGAGGNLCQDAINMINQDITRLLLGSIRPTGSDTDTGARAQAEVEQDSTDVLLNYDRVLLDGALTEHLVRCVWNLNRPMLYSMGLGDANMPKFKTSHQRKDNPSELVQVIATALQSGVELSKAEVYERLGWRQPEAGEEVFKGVQSMPGLPGGAPGGGGGSPFDVDEGEQFTAQMERLAAMTASERDAELSMFAKKPERCPDGTIMPKSGDCTGHGAAEEDEPKQRKNSGDDEASSEDQGEVFGSIKQATDAFKDMGIEDIHIDPEVSLDHLSSAYGAFKQAKDSGSAVPLAVEVLNDDERRYMAGEFDAKHELIRLNFSDAAIRNSIKARSKSSIPGVEKDKTGPAGIESTVFHELGHLNHSESIGIDRFYLESVGFDIKTGKYTSDPTLSDDDNTTAINEVSYYASTNSAEFVAEVYCGVLTGSKYGPEVEKMYIRFGGKPVRGFGGK